MIEELRTIAAMTFIAVVMLWVTRHPEEIRPLLPRRWIVEAKRMSRRDWAKCLGLIAIFTAIMLYAIPATARLTATTTKAPLVNPGVHPVYQVASVSPFLIMAISAFAVIFEEWIFRGIVLKKLARRFVSDVNSRWGKRVRVLCVLSVSSLLFGLFHLISQGTYFYAFVPPTVAGWFLGAAYLHGGLKVATPAHIGYNWIRLILVFLV